MDAIRILVLSQVSFSTSSANGRTLGNLFRGYPKEALAQFSLIAPDPDFDVCANIYQVSDRDAVRAFFGKKVGRRLEPPTEGEAKPSASQNSGGAHGRFRGSPAMLIARNIVWGRRGWRKGFDRWVAEFQPQLVLLQVGNMAFMIDLALEVARQYHIPLAVFNSENFYFKDFNYFRGSHSDFLYPVFQNHFRRHYRRMMEYATCFIYTCDKLVRLHREEFGTVGITIYTPATVIRHGAARKKEKFQVSYLGSLGLNRHLPLIQIAETLQKINPSLYLDVYGGADEDVKKMLTACPAVHYHGFVSYAEVLRIMEESSLLVHAEANDPFTARDLETGFSTKIADSLGCGTPFLLYAPKSIACAEYIMDNGGAFYASSPEELEPVLRDAMDLKKAQEKLDRAYVTAQENHCDEKNHQVFLDALRRAVETF